MKKLRLNKEIIATISSNQMNKIIGGTGIPKDYTVQKTDAICNNSPKPPEKTEPIPYTTKS